MIENDLERPNQTALPLVFALLAGAGALTFALSLAFDQLSVTFQLLLTVAATFAAAGCWRISGTGLHIAFRCLNSGLALVLAAYVVLATPGFDTASHPEHADLIGLRDFLPWLALATGLLALTRPVFALIPALCVLATKSTTELVHGIGPLSHTDYLPLVELSLFFAFALVLYACITKLRLRAQLPPADLGGLLVLAALAIHFGNYFYSGLKKIAFEEGPLHWALYSPTQYMTEAASVMGFLPIALWPELAATVHLHFAEWVVWSNLLVVLTQLACVVAIVRINWALWLTVWYDLTHILIFLTTGILFWKWILLNTLFILSLYMLKRQPPQFYPRLLLVALVPAANLFFFAAALAWYDSPALLDHHVIAVTRDGDRARVPSNYFLDTSVTIAQGRLGTPEGHFPTRTWGGTQQNAIRLQAENQCQFKGGEIVRPYNEQAVREFITRHHRFVQPRLNAYGQFNFDLYPHHIFSNPAAHKDFYALDLRELIKYEYVVESICLDGSLSTADDQVKYRTVLTVNLPDA